MQASYTPQSVSILTDVHDSIQETTGTAHGPDNYMGMEVFIELFYTPNAYHNISLALLTLEEI